MDHDKHNLSTSITKFRFKNYTQDLVYATKQIGRFHGLFGATYFHNQVAGNVIVNQTAFVGFNLVRTEAMAVFGEATFNLTDRLKMSGGLRYSHERKEAFKQPQFGTAVEPPVLPPLGSPASFNSLDPRLSLMYELSPDTNVYGTFTKGFKSGEFNPGGPLKQTTPANPERVTAYEVGIKNSTPGRFSFNAAALYYDYKDLQVNTLRTINGANQGILLNAANAKIKGAEVSGDWRVSDEFHVNFGLSYIDAKYESFPLASFTTPRREVPGNLCPVPLNASATTAICTIIADLSGNRMIRAPKFSGSVTATYTKEASAGAFDVSAALFATTKVFQEISNRVVQPGYALLNVTVSYSPPNSGFKARLFARNVTDKATLISIVNTNSYDNVTYSPPRSFGAELSYKF